ncbi:hypothetical protein BV22DRAFT_476037 [Leucogyrophana mollusca]|uniref:Uncharacterized protein n=1 Tax=Leucogyrophana mollusca TaxID=85980 RepID=A0ACB8BH90_9AGAM|nr:hypothetical protein BV22DRAFT_476037 [Leucogyrophana mollusca]
MHASSTIIVPHPYFLPQLFLPAWSTNSNHSTQCLSHSFYIILHFIIFLKPFCRPSWCVAWWPVAFSAASVFLDLPTVPSASSVPTFIFTLHLHIISFFEPRHCCSNPLITTYNRTLSLTIIVLIYKGSKVFNCRSLLQSQNLSVFPLQSSCATIAFLASIRFRAALTSQAAGLTSGFAYCVHSIYAPVILRTCEPYNRYTLRYDVEQLCKSYNTVDRARNCQLT